MFIYDNVSYCFFLFLFFFLLFFKCLFCSRSICTHKCQPSNSAHLFFRDVLKYNNEKKIFSDSDEYNTVAL